MSYIEIYDLSGELALRSPRRLLRYWITVTCLHFVRASS